MQRGSDNFADEFVSYAEASAALEMPPGALEALTGPGPFERLPDGRVTLRQCFGAALSTMLVMFDTEEVASIAVAAARDSCVGGSRTLGVVWHEGGKRMTAHWFGATEALPMRPVLSMPVERMLTLAVEHIEAFRRDAARPN